METAMNIQITTEHENCEYCNNFIDGSVEQFFSDDKYSVANGYGHITSASGYGGTTADGVAHSAMVSWAEKTNLYTVRFSQLAFHDWESRCVISSLELDGHEIKIVHETKRDIVISISEQLVKYFIADLEYQIEVIEQNNDGDSPATFKRALAKFQAVLQ